MSLMNRLNAHFATCAAAAVVGVGAAAANAAVVQSPVMNLAIPVNIDGVYVNVVTGATASSSFAGYDINPYSSSSLTWFSPGAPNHGCVAGGGSSATLVDNLALGSIIGGASVFATNTASESSGSTAFAFNSSNNYVGFRFEDATLGAGVRYGYMQIKLGASFTDATRAIVAIWYETSGEGITVVPAPGAVALLGLAGLVGKRRRVK